VTPGEILTKADHAAPLGGVAAQAKRCCHGTSGSMLPDRATTSSISQYAIRARLSKGPTDRNKARIPSRIAAISTAVLRSLARE
jgi:hypothetical protein